MAKVSCFLLAWLRYKRPGIKNLEEWEVKVTLICSQISPVSSDPLDHRQFIVKFSKGYLKED